MPLSLVKKVSKKLCIFAVSSFLFVSSTNVGHAEVGDSYDFWVSENFKRVQTSADLIASNDFVEVYVEKGVEYDSDRIEVFIKEIANNIDRVSFIYDNDKKNIPDVDGNGKVTVLFRNFSNDNVNGAFSFQNLEPSESTSSNKDLVELNSKFIISGSYYTLRDTESFFVHEFQHLTHYGFDKYEYGAVNEGMSVFVEKRYNSASNSVYNVLEQYLDFRQNSNAFDMIEYGLNYYTIDYLYNNFGGEEVLIDIIKSKSRNMASISETLTNRGFDISEEELYTGFIKHIGSDESQYKYYADYLKIQDTDINMELEFNGTVKGFTPNWQLFNVKPGKLNIKVNSDKDMKYFVVLMQGENKIPYKFDIYDTMLIDSSEVVETTISKENTVLKITPICYFPYDGGTPGHDQKVEWSLQLLNSSIDIPVVEEPVIDVPVIEIPTEKPIVDVPNVETPIEDPKDEIIIDDPVVTDPEDEKVPDYRPVINDINDKISDAIKYVDTKYLDEALVMMENMIFDNRLIDEITNKIDDAYTEITNIKENVLMTSLVDELQNAVDMNNLSILDSVEKNASALKNKKNKDIIDDKIEYSRNIILQNLEKDNVTIIEKLITSAIKNNNITELTKIKGDISSKIKSVNNKQKLSSMIDSGIESIQNVNDDKIISTINKSLSSAIKSGKISSLSSLRKNADKIINSDKRSEVITNINKAEEKIVENEDLKLINNITKNLNEAIKRNKISYITNIEKDVVKITDKVKRSKISSKINDAKETIQNNIDNAEYIKLQQSIDKAIKTNNIKQLESLKKSINSINDNSKKAYFSNVLNEAINTVNVSIDNAYFNTLKSQISKAKSKKDLKSLIKIERDIAKIKNIDHVKTLNELVEDAKIYISANKKVRR